MGDAAQVPTQWSVDVAAVAVCVLKQQKVSTGSRRREYLLNFAVISFLRVDWLELHSTAVSWRCELTYSGGGLREYGESAAKHVADVSVTKDRKKYEDEMVSGYAA
jgi:hypothetical protein